MQEPHARPEDQHAQTQGRTASHIKLEGGQSHQQIAAALGISKGVVTKYVGLAAAAGLDWPAVQAVDEAALEHRLLSASQPMFSYVRPDYGRIHQELRRKGVTLMLLWEEYCALVSDEHTPDQLNRTPKCGHHDLPEALSTAGQFGRSRRTGNRPGVVNALLAVGTMPAVS